MRAPLKRAAAFTLAVCTLSFQTGCKNDVDKGDEAIAEHVQAASQKLESGKPEDARQILEKDATNKSSSPSSQISAKVMLSQADMTAADSLARKLDQQEAQISALLLEIQRLGWQIAGNDAAAIGFGALNPSAGQQALQQAVAAAEKGEGGAWIKGNPSVPSLEAVTKQQEDLQKQIDDLTKQRTEVVAKRALALQQAGNYDRQADASTGSASTALVIQAANQRKEAADNDVKVRDFDTQLLPLQQQLAVVQQQRQGIEAAIASTRDQLQKLDSGWQAVQKQADEIKNYSKYLVDGSGGPPAGTTPPPGAAASGATTQPASTLTSLAGELDQQVKGAQDLRTQSVDLLNKAAKSYEEAGATAKTLVTELNTRAKSQDSAMLPEKHAWQDLISLNEEPEFKLRQANVYARLARLYSQQFTELAQRNAVARLVAPALKQAGIEPPQTLTSAIGDGSAPSPAVREPLQKIQTDIVKNDFTTFSEVPAQLDQVNAATPADQESVASTRTDLYYLWADSLLNDVVIAPGQGDVVQLRTNLAHVARMINAYGWSLIATLQGKPDFERGRLATAISERKAIPPDAHQLLPTVLPPELEEQPTTQATSQPAGEATPTTEPAAPTTAPTSAPAQ